VQFANYNIRTSLLAMIIPLHYATSCDVRQTIDPLQNGFLMLEQTANIWSASAVFFFSLSKLISKIFYKVFGNHNHTTSFNGMIAER
jgi:hypothetical protein